MLRPRVGWLSSLAALLCTGCIVASATPLPPTGALITATPPNTPTPPRASSTAITIVTATASLTPLPSATPLAPTLPPASATPPPDQASSTPFATETSTPDGATAVAPTPAPSVPPPTVPPQASAPAVGIAFFAISPQTINPGDVITLTWQATGDQAALYRQEPSGPLTDMRAVPLSGTLAIQTSADWRNQVTYVLYAGAGASNASATVAAAIRCPDQYFFANPPPGCPLSAAALEPMAAERFEHGLLIWRSSTHQIYALFADDLSRKWETLADTWASGQAESDPNLSPPAGLFQPVRGFGLVWRSNDPATGQPVRARLGWATETEAALTGALQCDSTPTYTNCFISGPGGAVYELLTEFSGWKVWP
jgi:hypothetical protein